MVCNNAFSWIEIPATELDRAQKFYETILNIQMIPLDFPDMRMRMFPIEDMMGLDGALCDSKGFHNPPGD